MTAFLIAENSNVLRLINQSKFKVGDIADCVTGFYSGDDKRFLQVISPDLKNGKNYKSVLYIKADNLPIDRGITVDQAIIISRNQGYKINSANA